MEIAGSIQQNLFPKEAPQLGGFDIAGAVFHAEQTSGDYFDFIPLRDGSLGVVVADVSGHGLGPALLMVETRAYLRALSQRCDHIDGILEQTNRVLARDVEDGRFVTLFFARVVSSERSLVCASAGHTGHHFDQAGIATPLPPTGLVLGIEENNRIQCTAPIRLQPGEIVLLMTDGLWETRSPDKALFGVERVIERVRALREQPASAIVDALRDDALRFAQHKPQQDDITIVVIKAVKESRQSRHLSTGENPKRISKPPCGFQTRTGRRERTTRAS